MYRSRQERKFCGRSTGSTNGRAAVVEEIVSVPTFKEEEEEEMQKQCCSLLQRESVRSKLLPFVPAAIDDDDWKVGAWTSSGGICKVAGGERGGRGGAVTGRKKEAVLSGVGGENSFESLDIRAAEVLGRSVQALESCSSLASCAFGTMRNSSGWEEGSWEVEKDKQHGSKSRDWDSSGRPLFLSSKGGIGGAAMDCNHGDHTLDILRVLKEIINSSDYAAKLSVGKMLMQDQDVTDVKENICGKHQLENAALSKANLWNESSKNNAVDGGHKLLMDPLTLSNSFLSCDSNGGALNCCRIPENLDVSQRAPDGAGGFSCKAEIDVKGSGDAMLERPVQSELTLLLGSKMRPPRGQKSDALKPPTKPEGGLQRRLKRKSTNEVLFSPHNGFLPVHRKSNLVALQRKKRGSWENRHGTKDPTHSERMKLVLLPKSPEWRGLSTAISAVRSIGHGEGEAGVVEAKARPLLLIAGKCIFRTSAPLDTPRSCIAFHRRKGLVPRPTNAKGPPTQSADDSTQNTRKAFSDAQSTTSPLMSRPTTSDRPRQRLLSANNCGSEALSIRHWPPVVAELDEWIAEIVKEWLDKDDHLAAVANSFPSSQPVIISSPVLSHTHDVWCKEKQGILGPLPAASPLELPFQLPTLHTDLRNPVSAPSKEVTELDARIGQAQTVHDLCQILEPICQTGILSVPGNNVEGDMKVIQASIIHEFGRDDIVQDFQRRIHVLEQEIEDLKSSVSKQEYSALFQRLQEFGL